MSASSELTKYTIEGLDCANCADRIEHALRRLDGFEGVSVSFSTGTVLIPADRREEAQAAISRLEPDARLVERRRPGTAAGREPGHKTGGSTGSGVSARGGGVSRSGPFATAHDPAQQPGRSAGSGGAGGTPGGDSRRSGRPQGPRTRLLSIVRTIRPVAPILIALALTLAGILYHDTLHETPFRWAEYAVFLPAYLLVGRQVLWGAARNIVRGRIFDELFLMSVATIGAIVIHELAEAVAVMLFYSVGEYVQEHAVDRSRRSISSLMDLRPEFARVVTDEGTTEADPESIDVGQTIEIRPGERVPLDGEVVLGRSSVDTSALTGESVPRSIAEEDMVLAGFVNGTGTIRIRVTKAFSASSVSRILELVEDAAGRKAPTERFISRFSAVYTPIVVGVAAVIAFVPPLLVPGAVLGEWIYRALVMLVISCPCALVISIPLGYFGGIGGASRNGILVKGANYLDALTDLSTVVLDKTGTLTRGTFEVVRTEARNGFDPEEVLELAAHAEAHSSHPIARSIRAAYDGPLDPDSLSEVREERGYGITAKRGDRTILAGSDRLLHREQVPHADCEAEGTVVYVAVDRTYAGYIVIADELKSDAAGAVASMKRLGVEEVVMLTGDNEVIAQGVARRVGIDTVYAELLPEQKVSVVEEIAARLPAGKRAAFVGDGMNDAPVIMRSDIGVAMGALGSDAAIEAADIVLMNDQVEGVGDAIRVARHTRTVVIQNIVLALAVKVIFLSLGAAGIATMWEAVIADMGTSILAVLNATRTLRYSPPAIGSSVSTSVLMDRR